MYRFTGEEAQMVCGWHQERWGIESRVSLTAKGPVVWLTLAGTARLHQLIAPHVPPCMEYKLLPQNRGKFQEMTDDKAPSGLAASAVRAVAPVPTPDDASNVEVADDR